MYYSASSHLINRGISTETACAIDRTLARAHHGSEEGFIELSRLASAAGIPAGDLAVLMTAYVDAGVAVVRLQVQCTACLEVSDADEKECPSCGEPRGELDRGDECYRVVARPLQPCFDPDRQPLQPDAFLSYRDAACGTLASDLYYSLEEAGRRVFLDRADVPPGSNAELLFLRAASAAPHFIALVSPSYFDSQFCRKELAHAARTGARILRVNLQPVAAPPPAMPWIQGLSWVRSPASAEGLGRDLVREIDAALRSPAGPDTVADLRKEGCSYLLGVLTRAQLVAVWNCVGYMDRHEVPESLNEAVRMLLGETSESRLNMLCAALAPG